MAQVGAVPLGAMSALRVKDKFDGHFDGRSSNSVLPPLQFVRSESMHINNDPRFFTDSVLLKRLDGFRVVAVTSTIFCTLSVKNVMLLESSKLKVQDHPLQLVALVLMTLVFMLNILTVIVLVSQTFHVWRLTTTGSTGFEVSRSYYTNHNIVVARRWATRGFFISVPMFVIAMASTNYVEFTEGKSTQWVRAYIVCGLMVLAAIFISLLTLKISAVFHEKYRQAAQYNLPLIEHMHRSDSS